MIKILVWFTSTLMTVVILIVSQYQLRLLSSYSSGNNFTVSLLTQRAPYTRSTLHEFDPNLGRHDAFLLLGPYIFAQKTDSENIINLYVSFNRQPFQKAKIPTTEPHQVSSSVEHYSSLKPPFSTSQNYIVSHIDWQQAMVIVEHSSGQYNLYLSDITGVYFSLSLPDIVVEANSGTDLELVSGNFQLHRYLLFANRLKG